MDKKLYNFQFAIVNKITNISSASITVPENALAAAAEKVSMQVQLGFEPRLSCVTANE